MYAVTVEYRLQRTTILLIVYHSFHIVSSLHSVYLIVYVYCLSQHTI